MSKLREWREYQRPRLTQEAAGALVSVSGVAWSRYENGRVPTPDIMQKIIEVTAGAVTADDFFVLPEAEAEPARVDDAA